MGNVDVLIQFGLYHVRTIRPLKYPESMESGDWMRCREVLARTVERSLTSRLFDLQVIDLLDAYLNAILFFEVAVGEQQFAEWISSGE